MQFAQIPGFESLKEVLVQAGLSGHVAHAQLFAGQHGSAALVIALAYATYLNCQEPTPTDSCGQCASCVKYNKLAHPDLNLVFPVATSKAVPDSPSSAAYLKQFRAFVADQPFGGPQEWGQFFGAENKQLNIAVGESRYIVQALSLKPYEARWKVMVIWLPEFMNLAAANALLKVLEEPTPDTLFFLVTESVDKLLATILSRTQMVRIPAFETSQVAHYLINTLGVEAPEAQVVARLAEGSLAEAKRLLEENTGAYYELFTTWMRSCYGHKYPELLQTTEAFGKLGREGQKAFFQYAISMVRDTLLAHLKLTDMVLLPAEELAFVTRFAPFVHEDNTQAILEKLGQASATIERNGNPKITFFDTSLYLTELLRQPAPVWN